MLSLNEIYFLIHSLILVHVKFITNWLGSFLQGDFLNAESCCCTCYLEIGRKSYFRDRRRSAVENKYLLPYGT